MTPRDITWHHVTSRELITDTLARITPLPPLFHLQSISKFLLLTKNTARAAAPTQLSRELSGQRHTQLHDRRPMQGNEKNYPTTYNHKTLVGGKHTGISRKHQVYLLTCTIDMSCMASVASAFYRVAYTYATRNLSPALSTQYFLALVRLCVVHGLYTALNC